MEALITDIKPFKTVEHLTVSAEIDGEVIKADCLITHYSNSEDVIIRVTCHGYYVPEVKRIFNTLIHRKYSPKHFKAFPYDIENFCDKCFSASYKLIESEEGSHLKCKNCNNIKLIKTYGF